MRFFLAGLAEVFLSSALHGNGMLWNLCRGQRLIQAQCKEFSLNPGSQIRMQSATSGPRTSGRKSAGVWALLSEFSKDFFKSSFFQCRCLTWSLQPRGLVGPMTLMLSFRGENTGPREANCWQISGPDSNPGFSRLHVPGASLAPCLSFPRSGDSN